ncbi:sensor histidine kinase [Flindersiella endophytica]
MTDRPRVDNTTVAVLAAAVWVLLALVLAEPNRNPFVMLGLLIGASFTGAGAFAWRSRPRNRVGLLMVAVGIAWLPHQLAMSSDDPLTEYAVSASTMWIAVIAHLMLAFPTGRVGTLVGRVLVGLVYTSAVAIGLADGYLVSLGLLPGKSATELRTLVEAPWPVTVAALIDDLQVVPIVVLGTAVLLHALIRWQASSSTQRRAAAPVLISGAIAIGLFVAGEVIDTETQYEVALDVCMFWAFAAIPLAYLLSRMRGRIDRAGVADLVVRLRDQRPTGNLEEALASALHDPGLRVGYWMPERSGYVDADGRPVDVPVRNADQVVTRVDRAGSRFAVLIHDPALLEEPELVDAACAAAALALENERLAAELRAKLVQLDASRSRVLQATEAERRRLERDLHDGVQQHLLSAAMTLGLAETTLSADDSKPAELVGEAKNTVLSALDDLRALCHGIHPTVLTERGLLGAVRELTAVASVPVECSVDLPATVPPAVETAAYYIVNEALANLTKHAKAARAWITISQVRDSISIEVRDDGRGGADPALGSGLRGLADRVEAQRGTFALTSPPGAGTTIRAALPCA